MPQPSSPSGGPIVPTVESPAAVLDSDRLNSNVPTVSEGERNRAKVLGSTVGDFLNEDHANANVEQLVVATASAGLRKLTEAQRNKLKILSQEFEIAPPDEAGTMDENCNRLAERRKNRERILISDYTSREEEAAPGGQPVPGRELSELQKNRRKIMSQEYNLLTDEAVWDGTGGRDPNQKRTMYLNLDSDRARNRRRILESEFDIATRNAGMPSVRDADDGPVQISNGAVRTVRTAAGSNPTRHRRRMAAGRIRLFLVAVFAVAEKFHHRPR